ncbi:MAG: hypothetical protein QOK43_2894 [Acidimicrobiaceae bacterium]|nr:hypothetical protein [Acidimicrobiaceae bacterium]
MANATTHDAPSQALRDSIANATEEGLELERLLINFAGNVRQAGIDFDAEVSDLDDSDPRYQHAAVRSGLGVLHAMVEQMADILSEALGDPEEYAPRVAA